MNLDEMVARFADIGEDIEAFKDVQDPENRRVVKYLVARHSDYAAVRHRENITVAILESMPGKGPKLHAHDYPEIFFCQQGTYDIVWGDHGEHAVTLHPLDTFTVPAGVNRQVMNSGDTPGSIMVLFDTTRVDPNEGITLPPHEIEAERAAGKDYDRRALAGIPMTPDQMDGFVARHNALPDSERDGGHTLRRVIDPGSDQAAIQTPHDLTMAIAESEPGAVSAEQTTSGNELLIGLSGQISVTSGDQTTTLEAYDTLPLPAGVTRQYRNSGDGPAALLIEGEVAAASA